MKIKHPRRLTVAIILFLIVGLFSLGSCVSSPSQVTFYNAGATDFTATGSEFVQYFLYRFDTSASGYSFTIPAASDIVSAISSPVAGSVLIFGVTADGANPVTIVGGTNVTVRPSASTVNANSTLTIYCVIDNTGSGTQAVTIY
jgi:hypothetical protein